jgi:hypothetical protein
MDPWSSTGKWSLAYAERMSHAFYHGINFSLISGKLWFQARKMENLCMKIISYPWFTHKEQIIKNMRRQGNVDCQSKSIVELPQTAFVKSMDSILST